MTDTIWILLSTSQEHESPSQSLEKVYWEEPMVEDLKDQFHIPPGHDYLNPYFESMLKGTKTILYGVAYWIQKFIKPKN